MRYWICLFFNSFILIRDISFRSLSIQSTESICCRTIHTHRRTKVAIMIQRIPFIQAVLAPHRTPIKANFSIKILASIRMLISVNFIKTLKQLETMVHFHQSYNSTDFFGKVFFLYLYELIEFFLYCNSCIYCLLLLILCIRLRLTFIL